MSFYAYDYGIPDENSASEEEEGRLIKETFESMGSQVPFQDAPAETILLTPSYTNPTIETIPSIVLPSSTLQSTIVPSTQSTTIQVPVIPLVPVPVPEPIPVSVVGETLPSKKSRRVRKTKSTSASGNRPISEYGVDIPIEYVSESESLPAYSIQPRRQQVENVNWSGPLPLNEYPVNQDDNPDVLTRKTEQPVEYTQEVSIRYLKPPSPVPHGDIIIQHEKSVVPPPAPPVVIHQQPPLPETPLPVVIREAPPRPLAQLPTKIINLPPVKVPPPPRKVIIERFAQLPSRPPPLVVERWLPFKYAKRRVVYKKPEPIPVYEKIKNVIIQYETPKVVLKREFRDLGVVRVNPEEYMAKFGSQVKRAEELPDFVRTCPPPQGLVLASDVREAPKILLEGDLEALSLVDLDREGLSELKGIVQRQTSYLVSDVPSQPTYTYPSQLYSTSTVPQPVYNIPVETQSSKQATILESEKPSQLYSTSTVPQPVYVTSAAMETQASKQATLLESEKPSQLYSTATAPQPVYSNPYVPPQVAYTVRAPVETPKIQTWESEKPSFEAVATRKKSPESYPLAPSQVYMSSHADLNSLVDDIIDSVVLKSDNKINFFEAKEFIKMLNERLNRSCDEARAERFLESINLNRDTATLELEVFKKAIMRSLEFQTISMF